MNYLTLRCGLCGMMFCLDPQLCHFFSLVTKISDKVNSIKPFISATFAPNLVTFSLSVTKKSD